MTSKHSSPQSAEDDIASQWAKQAWLLLSFLLIALSIAVLALLQIDAESLLSLEFPAFLVLAIALQFLSMLCNSWNWQTILAMSGGAKISFHSSIVYSGISFIGKYIPGKFGGVVMRAWAQSRSNSSPDAAIKASLIDQLAAAHSGVFIIAFLSAYYGEGMGVLAWGIFALLVLAGLLLSGWGVRCGSLLLDKIPWFKGKLSALGDDFSIPYAIGFCRMFPVWLITAAAIQCCAAAFAVELEYLQVLLMTAIAFLAGFAVFILPAGIGAREGALVFLLTPFCPLATAITIASLYRLVSIAIDLAFGTYSLQRMRRTAETLV